MTPKGTFIFFRSLPLVFLVCLGGRSCLTGAFSPLQPNGGLPPARPGPQTGASGLGPLQRTHPAARDLAVVDQAAARRQGWRPVALLRPVARASAPWRRTQAFAEQLIDSAAGDAPSRPAAERDPEQGPGPEEPPGLLFADGERCGRLGHGHCVSARRGQFEGREVVRVDAVIGGPGEEGGGVLSLRKADESAHLLDFPSEPRDLALQLCDRAGHGQMILLLRHRTRCCTKAHSPV